MAKKSLDLQLALRKAEREAIKQREKARALAKKLAEKEAEVKKLKLKLKKEHKLTVENIRIDNSFKKTTVTLTTKKDIKKFETIQKVSSQLQNIHDEYKTALNKFANLHRKLSPSDRALSLDYQKAMKKKDDLNIKLAKKQEQFDRKLSSLTSSSKNTTVEIYNKDGDKLKQTKYKNKSLNTDRTKPTKKSLLVVAQIMYSYETSSSEMVEAGEIRNFYIPAGESINDILENYMSKHLIENGNDAMLDTYFKILSISERTLKQKGKDF